jgi:hypothetical protein
VNVRCEISTATLCGIAPDTAEAAIDPDIIDIVNVLPDVGDHSALEWMCHNKIKLHTAQTVLRTKVISGVEAVGIGLPVPVSKWIARYWPYIFIAFGLIGLVYRLLRG